MTSRIVWIRSWALQSCCVNLGYQSLPVPQFPQVRCRNHYLREGRTMLRSRRFGVRFVWLFTDCLQGESGTPQTSKPCWSLPHLHTGRDSLRRSLRGANGVTRGDCRMHLFPHKQMGLSWNPSPAHRPLSLPMHTLILLYKRRPNSFCPKNRIWKTVCLMSCPETSFTVNGLKPPLPRSPSKPTISTNLAHAIIWLDGQIFHIIQTKES